jgi:fructose-specific phosphotransferase system IIA component
MRGINIFQEASGVTEHNNSHRKPRIGFADKLSEKYILLDMKSQTKDQAIRDLAESLRGNPSLLDFDRFLKDVYKREKDASTGIGKGIAIPHARTNTVKDFIVAIGRKSPGIDFASVDGKSVEILILMGAPLTGVNAYLKLLARLSHILKRPGFIDGIKKAADQKAVIEIFRTYEK